MTRDAEMLNQGEDAHALDPTDQYVSRERSRPRVAYDSDLVVSAHETLENFDLSLATEDKAFVHARQYTDRSCVYLIIALFNMVKIMKRFGSLGFTGPFFPLQSRYCGI